MPSIQVPVTAAVDRIITLDHIEDPIVGSGGSIAAWIVFSPNLSECTITAFSFSATYVHYVDNYYDNNNNKMDMSLYDVDEVGVFIAQIGEKVYQSCPFSDTGTNTYYLNCTFSGFNYTLNEGHHLAVLCNETPGYIGSTINIYAPSYGTLYYSGSQTPGSNPTPTPTTDTFSITAPQLPSVVQAGKNVTLTFKNKNSLSINGSIVLEENEDTGGGDQLIIINEGEPTTSTIEATFSSSSTTASVTIPADIFTRVSSNYIHTLTPDGTLDPDLYLPEEDEYVYDEDEYVAGVTGYSTAIDVIKLIVHASRSDGQTAETYFYVTRPALTLTGPSGTYSYDSTVNFTIANQASESVTLYLTYGNGNALDSYSCGTSSSKSITVPFSWFATAGTSNFQVTAVAKTSTRESSPVRFYVKVDPITVEKTFEGTLGTYDNATFNIGNRLSQTLTVECYNNNTGALLRTKHDVKSDSVSITVEPSWFTSSSLSVRVEVSDGTRTVKTSFSAALEQFSISTSANGSNSARISFSGTDYQSVSVEAWYSGDYLENVCSNTTSSYVTYTPSVSKFIENSTRSMYITFRASSCGRSASVGYTFSCPDLTISASKTTITGIGTTTITLGNIYGEELSYACRYGGSIIPGYSGDVALKSDGKSFDLAFANDLHKGRGSSDLQITLRVTGNSTGRYVEKTLYHVEDTTVLPTITAQGVFPVNDTGDEENVITDWVLGFSKALCKATASASGSANIQKVELTFSDGSGTPVRATYYSASGLYEATTKEPITKSPTTLRMTVTDTRNNTSYASFIISSVVNGAPALSNATASIEQPESAKDFPNTWIAGYTKAKCAVEVTSPYSFTITGVKLSFPGGTPVDAEYDSSTGKWVATTLEGIPGNVPLTLAATDENGAVGTTTINLSNVFDYYEPTLTITSVTRCDESGKADSGGSKCKVCGSVTYCTGLTGNAIKQVTAGIAGQAASAFNVASENTITGLDISSAAYVLEFKVRDLISDFVKVYYVVPGAVEKHPSVVKLNGSTLVDISSSTVTHQRMLNGVVAFDRTGSKIRGTLLTKGVDDIKNDGEYITIPAGYYPESIPLQIGT